ncbi:hypothetical protein Ais01nite_25020 [Asanoa ishikariensis]|uniref:Uncharacterized protein n=1 Tax=Asanoa ishikariensis TaxID=137265 RepID=A0A1H3R3A2_9ACTN|nr:hypothetical protein [Asanoa ishikariensis]GIF64467.1 hypothetical protein Ais01nite_25020 [Asanoa ishikariensis]SDZ20003.1 hypothetical protein SAMN05421684_3417 [Asanoa ishikariensis]
MSDFDEVLERLVVDPAFASALASDPGLALASYSLSDDEIALLHTQVGGDSTTEHAVETRANQSSTFGLLGSLGGLFADGGPISGTSGLGHAATSGLGSPAGQSGLGPAGYDGASFGPYAQAEGTHGGMGGLSGFGDEISQGLAETAPAGTDAMGSAPDAASGTAGLGPAVTGGHAGLGPAAPETPSSVIPDGYHTRVDVDGDGDWDKHVLLGRGDGGVDIMVDNDRDGRVDFVGHDTDGDGLVNSADYDKDGDGVFEKTMYDDNGDGWMDRTVHH